MRLRLANFLGKPTEGTRIQSQFEAFLNKVEFLCGKKETERLRDKLKEIEFYSYPAFEILLFSGMPLEVALHKLPAIVNTSRVTLFSQSELANAVALNWNIYKKVLPSEFKINK